MEQNTDTHNVHEPGLDVNCSYPPLPEAIRYVANTKEYSLSPEREQLGVGKSIQENLLESYTFCPVCETWVRKSNTWEHAIYTCRPLSKNNKEFSKRDSPVKKDNQEIEGCFSNISRKNPKDATYLVESIHSDKIPETLGMISTDNLQHHHSRVATSNNFEQHNIYTKNKDACRERVYSLKNIRSPHHVGQCHDFLMQESKLHTEGNIQNTTTTRPLPTDYYLYTTNYAPDDPVHCSLNNLIINNDHSVSPSNKPLIPEKFDYSIYSQRLEQQPPSFGNISHIPKIEHQRQLLKPVLYDTDTITDVNHLENLQQSQQLSYPLNSQYHPSTPDYKFQKTIPARHRRLSIPGSADPMICNNNCFHIKKEFFSSPSLQDHRYNRHETLYDPYSSTNAHYNERSFSFNGMNESHSSCNCCQISEDSRMVEPSNIYSEPYHNFARYRTCCLKSRYPLNDEYNKWDQDHLYNHEQQINTLHQGYCSHCTCISCQKSSENSLRNHVHYHQSSLPKSKSCQNYHTPDYSHKNIIPNNFLQQVTNCKAQRLQASILNQSNNDRERYLWDQGHFKYENSTRLHPSDSPPYFPNQTRDTAKHFNCNSMNLIQLPTKSWRRTHSPITADYINRSINNSPINCCQTHCNLQHTIPVVPNEMLPHCQALWGSPEYPDSQYYLSQNRSFPYSTSFNNPNRQHIPLPTRQPSSALYEQSHKSTYPVNLLPSRPNIQEQHIIIPKNPLEDNSFSNQQQFDSTHSNQQVQEQQSCQNHNTWLYAPDQVQSNESFITDATTASIHNSAESPSSKSIQGNSTLSSNKSTYIKNYKQLAKPFRQSTPSVATTSTAGTTPTTSSLSCTSMTTQTFEGLEIDGKTKSHRQADRSNCRRSNKQTYNLNNQDIRSLKHGIKEDNELQNMTVKCRPKIQIKSQCPKEKITQQIASKANAPKTRKSDSHSRISNHYNGSPLCRTPDGSTGSLIKNGIQYKDIKRLGTTSTVPSSVSNLTKEIESDPPLDSISEKPWHTTLRCDTIPSRKTVSRSTTVTTGNNCHIRRCSKRSPMKNTHFLMQKTLINNEKTHDTVLKQQYQDKTFYSEIRTPSPPSHVILSSSINWEEQENKQNVDNNTFSKQNTMTNLKQMVYNNSDSIQQEKQRQEKQRCVFTPIQKTFSVQSKEVHNKNVSPHCELKNSSLLEYAERDQEKNMVENTNLFLRNEMQELVKPPVNTNTQFPRIRSLLYNESYTQPKEINNHGLKENLSHMKDLVLHPVSSNTIVTSNDEYKTVESGNELKETIEFSDLSLGLNDTILIPTEYGVKSSMTGEDIFPIPKHHIPYSQLSKETNQKKVQRRCFSSPVYPRGSLFGTQNAEKDYNDKEKKQCNKPTIFRSNRTNTSLDIKEMQLKNTLSHSTPIGTSIVWDKSVQNSLIHEIELNNIKKHDDSISRNNTVEQNHSNSERFLNEAQTIEESQQRKLETESSKMDHITEGNWLARTLRSLVQYGNSSHMKTIPLKVSFPPNRSIYHRDPSKTLRTGAYEIIPIGPLPPHAAKVTAQVAAGNGLCAPLPWTSSGQLNNNLSTCDMY